MGYDCRSDDRAINGDLMIAKDMDVLFRVFFDSPFYG
jgi:hypothetical protein